MTARFVRLNPDCFEYHPSFLHCHEADGFLQTLWNELNWTQREIRMFGRRILQPRLIAWHGDPAAVYEYSGLTLSPEPWHPALSMLRDRVVAFTGRPANAVLANAYRDGNDSMGWHSDDERELGDRPFVSSLSLGAERRLLLREKGRKSSGITLEHGSLLVMKGDSQQLYQHALPKTRRTVGLRINLTFREIRAQAPV